MERRDSLPTFKTSTKSILDRQASLIFGQPRRMKLCLWRRDSPSYGITCYYLFGSRANSDLYPDSDVDLAVTFRDFSKESHTLALELEMQEALTQALDPLPVDLVFLQRVPVHLRFNIIKRGLAKC